MIERGELDGRGGLTEANVEEFERKLRDAGVRVVDLLFSDIAGGIKALTIPVEGLRATLQRGYRFDGAAIAGGDRRAELDLYLVPDPETLVITPPHLFGLSTEPRGRLYCSVRRHDGQPFAGDPRSTLERVLLDAAAAGYDYRVGLEIEYYLLRADVDPIAISAGGGIVRGEEAIADESGYFAVGEDELTGTRDEIVATLQSLGVQVGGAHHETGPGQEELDLVPTGGISMADQIMTVRQVIRSVAERRGFRATFMPKPFRDMAGSGMHLFQQLLRYPSGEDLLRDARGDEELSRTARLVIAGQMSHAAAMCAIVAPTVNSYKRLAAGHRAPRHARWARVGESALIRVPAGTAGEPLQLELRSPDAMTNPYLAIAAAVTCGLDGITQGEEPAEPLDESLVAYEDEELERLGTPRLPMTLGEAIEALAEDDVIRTALGDYIFEQLLTVKRAEWDDYRRDVSPWEHRRYLN